MSFSYRKFSLVIWASKIYAYKTTCHSFGPHKLANAFDAFLKRKAVPTQPPVSQSDSITTHQFLTGNILAASTVSDLAISSSKTTTSTIDLNSEMNNLSITPTAVIATSPQPPVTSQPFTVLLVEDNEINLKVRT